MVFKNYSLPDFKEAIPLYIVLFQSLEKAITTNIEQEITQKVKSVEAKAFKMIASPSGASSSKTPGEAKKMKLK